MASVGEKEISSCLVAVFRIISSPCPNMVSCGTTIVGHFICFSFGVIDADKVSGAGALSGLGMSKFLF